MELSELREQQTNRAKQMREGMQGLKQEQATQVQNRGREELARQVSGVRQNFGTRGLLYSGLRRGAESGAAGNIAAQGAGQIAAGNAQLGQQLQGMEDQAVQSGLQEQQIKQGEADTAYERALQERKMASSVPGMLSSLGKKIGL